MPESSELRPLISSTFPQVFVKMTDRDRSARKLLLGLSLGPDGCQYTLTITDTITGYVRTYRRGAPEGAALCGESDTSAFRN